MTGPNLSTSGMSTTTKPRLPSSSSGASAGGRRSVGMDDEQGFQAWPRQPR